MAGSRAGCDARNMRHPGAAHLFGHRARWRSGYHVGLLAHEWHMPKRPLSCLQLECAHLALQTRSRALQGAEGASTQAPAEA